MSTPAAARGQLTAFDSIAAVITGLTTIGLATFPLVASRFAAMYRDLGGQLPLFTRIVLAGWPQPTVAIVVLAMIGFALRARRPLRQRRAAIVGAFAVAMIAFSASAIGLYLPIFTLAGNIEAD